MERNILHEKKYVKECLDFPLDLTQIWYTIDAMWWKKWKRYVNYGNNGQTVIESEPPGAINNEKLIENGIFNQNALIEFDYEIVPENVWNWLTNIYGCMQSDVTIFKRFVIKDNNVLRVELFPLKIRFQIYGDHNDSNVIEQTFSCVTKLSQIERFIQNAYSIPEGAIFQLIQEFEKESLHVIHCSSETITLSDARFKSNQRLFVDVKNSEGDFGFKENRSNYVNSNGSVKGGSSSIVYGPHLAASPSLYKIDESLNESRYTPGVCGLSNLGNTCFMNSAIQCISNVYPITQYFLKNSWTSDLNKDNPLGMDGRIATAYANLIREMWSGKVAYALPREFKYEVAQFAPQFCGYSQHDSQELMMFLLDGLHEDLNRITNKPYIEQKNCTSQSDQVVADENWKYHLKRNNSIIVDYFHGQLKSKVVCPDCNFVSVTFDPFASLSLPLRHSYYQPVIFYPLDPASPILEMSVLIYKKTSLETLKNFVEKQVKWNPRSQIILAHVKKGKIARFLKDTETMPNCTMDDYVVLYEVSALQPDHFYIDISFKEKALFSYTSLPIVVQVPRKLNWTNFIGAIKCQWSRFFNDSVVNCDLDPLLIECTDKIDFIDNQSFTDDSSDFERSESISNSSIDSQRAATCNPFENVFSVVLLEKLASSTNEHEINPLSRNRPLKPDADQHIVIEWTNDGFKSAFKEPVKRTISCVQQLPKLTIEDCLKQFLCEEHLGHKDLWFCPKCKKDEAASKKLDIWRLPKVLVVHLKRFKATSYFGDKINSEVLFPIKNLNLSQYVPDVEDENDYIYDLVAVSNHVGCLAGGHYFAFAKNHLDGRWYKFDDSNTSCVDESEIVAKSAYVLVYVARSCNRDQCDISVTTSTDHSLFAADGDDNNNNNSCRANGDGDGECADSTTTMMMVDINCPE